jgi:methylenetetrahydrofolate dehydrogenase (NADP+)/methenyltetrahydrofolate cyclohydrolase
VNQDDDSHGMVLQLPLPLHLHPSFFKIVKSISPLKDIDCISPDNYSNMSLYESGDSILPKYLKDNNHLISKNLEYLHGSRKIFPCTALSIDQMIFKYQINCEGKNVVILGKSYLVGTPINSLFVSKGAKVNICNINTKNIKELIKSADILVTCTGSQIDLEVDDFREGLILFDVGIAFEKETGIVRGDVNLEKIKERLGYFTPVPGGLGPLTVANMIHNLYLTFLKQQFE